ncbi:hypothetical protein SDC9_187021 [bioreactor metagenome]|uniref:Uncharacterized protein n=1 Tax=bioreactor metagenome TaxID=1076179 RepID=A0A645HVW4_9ZZZZ
MHKLGNLFQRNIALAIFYDIFTGFINNTGVQPAAILQHVIQETVQRIHHPAVHLILGGTLHQLADMVKVEQRQLRHAGTALNRRPGQDNEEFQHRGFDNLNGPAFGKNFIQQLAQSLFGLFPVPAAHPVQNRPLILKRIMKCLLT